MCMEYVNRCNFNSIVFIINYAINIIVYFNIYILGVYVSCSFSFFFGVKRGVSTACLVILCQHWLFAQLLGYSDKLTGCYF